MGAPAIGVSRRISGIRTVHTWVTRVCLCYDIRGEGTDGSDGCGVRVLRSKAGHCCVRDGGEKRGEGGGCFAEDRGYILSRFPSR